MKVAITSKGVPALVYKAHLDAKFGNAWLDWEPETLWSAIEEEWGSEPSDGSKAAIMAVRVLLSNDDFYENIPTFEAVILGLNNSQPAFSRLEVAAPHEIAYGIALAQRIRKKDAKQFSPDIIGYVQGSMREYGNYAYPNVLKFAEPDGDEAIRAKIERAAKSPKKDPSSLIEVQAAKLHDLQVYIDARTQEYEALKKRE